MGPNLGPIYAPQIPQNPPVSPGGYCVSKTKKHVKPLIDKHFTRFYWRRHPDSNWGIKILQTFALPLGYGALKNGAVDEARTRDLHLGKVALYQLSYYRIINRIIPGADENRNAFTAKPHPGIDRFDNGIIIQDLHGICKSESGGNALFFLCPG